MRSALPIWNQHLSPVFDGAEHRLRVEVAPAHEPKRASVRGTETQPARRAEPLASMGGEVLPWGAVTRPLEDRLNKLGICVLGRRRSEVAAVLHAFLHGQLNEPRFCLPGCGREPRRRRTPHPSSE